MLRLGTIAFAFIVVAGCEGRKPEGLPPAKDWQAPTPGATDVPGTAQAGGGRIDPHAGVAGAPPIGGGADPHAGVAGAPPLGGGAADPHAGVAGAPPLGGGGGGPDVTAMGLPAPDPDKPVDPSKVLSGVVTLGAAHAGKVPAGSVIFVSVRTVDPATGQGVGMPLAAEKLVVGGTWPIAFRLDEANAMIGGTGFAGDVVVAARFDQDSEARSKQPGDIVGQVRATIPATNLTISLDQMLQ
jgi:hypothetical protein